MFSTMVPDAPLPPAVKVTPAVGLGGVMFPGADTLQLVIPSDYAPESISSWSTVNSTERVLSIGVQQPVPNSAKFNSLTSFQLLM